MADSKPEALTPVALEKPKPEKKSALKAAAEKLAGEKLAAEKAAAETISAEKVPAEKAAPDIPSVMSADHTLGKIMIAARERRGLTQSQSSVEANIPAYYLEMIENDDYSAIADQLYLLPFLRRYAIFVRLDPEEVASRFIRDVQRADMNATRMSEPIAMIERREKSRSLPLAVIAGATFALLALSWIVYRLFFAGPSAPPASAPVASPAAQAAPQALPPKSAMAAPQVAVPQARPQPQTISGTGSQSSSPASKPDVAPRAGNNSAAPIKPRPVPLEAHPPLPPPEPDTE